MTLMLDCGCIVFVRDGEPVGRALRTTAAGDQLTILRRCGYHGLWQEVVAAVKHAQGQYLLPAWLRGQP